MKHFTLSVFTAVSLITGASLAAAQEPTTVRMSYVNVVAMAPLYAAEEEGFFAKHGIKNEYTIAPNPYNLLPAQSQGEIDVNIVGTSAAYFNAHNQGLK